MKEVLLLSMMIEYKECGIEKVIEDLEAPVESDIEIIAMLDIMLRLYNLIDDKNDKIILLNTIQTNLEKMRQNL